ncbi:hypothetical protein TNCV_99211 [Trichonephila clavipes]|nr:hypothetical protein TNCV_99211 [Trichonephila clavipes]
MQAFGEDDDNVSSIMKCATSLFVFSYSHIHDCVIRCSSPGLPFFLELDYVRRKSLLQTSKDENRADEQGN